MSGMNLKARLAKLEAALEGRPAELTLANLVLWLPPLEPEDAPEDAPEDGVGECP